MTHTCPDCGEPTIEALEHDDPNPESSKRAWFRECSDCPWLERIEPDSD